MGVALIRRVAARYSQLAMPSRIAERFARQIQAAEVPAEVVKALKAAEGKMEGVLKAKTGLKFESLGANNYSDGELVQHFQGPTKKGTKSPTPTEPNGRFSLIVSIKDDEASVTAAHLPWDKNRINLTPSVKEVEKGVALDKIDEVAVKLLGEVAGKAKLKK